MKAYKLSATQYIVAEKIQETENVIGYVTNGRDIFLREDYMRYSNEYASRHWEKITHSTEFLENVEPLSLSDVEEAIFGYSAEKLAEKFILEKVKLSSQSPGVLIGHIEGFKSHQKLSKDKVFTESDMREAFRAGDNYRCWENNGSRSTPSDVLDEDNYIQSKQPKTEWNVTFDEQGKLKLI